MHIEEINNPAWEGFVGGRWQKDIDSSLALAEKFGIMSIPALRIFKDGQLVASFDGVTKADEILAAAVG